MLLTTPVRVILLKYCSNSAQVSTQGARPDSGNANTELSRAESNAVSWPCTNGLEADSAMKCGM